MHEVYDLRGAVGLVAFRDETSNALVSPESIHEAPNCLPGERLLSRTPGRKDEFHFQSLHLLTSFLKESTY